MNRMRVGRAYFDVTLKNDVVSQVFGRINPIDNIFSSLDNVLVDYKTSIVDNWQFLTPLIIFCLFAGALLIFAMRYFEKQGIIKSE